MLVWAKVLGFSESFYESFVEVLWLTFVFIIVIFFLLLKKTLHNLVCRHIYFDSEIVQKPFKKILFWMKDFLYNFKIACWFASEETVFRRRYVVYCIYLESSSSFAFLMRDFIHFSNWYDQSLLNNRANYLLKSCLV